MPETATAPWTATPGVTEKLELSLTTQGPLYPPSEVMDADGNFVVVGMVNRATSDGPSRRTGRGSSRPQSTGTTHPDGRR